MNPNTDNFNESDSEVEEEEEIPTQEDPPANAEN